MAPKPSTERYAPLFIKVERYRDVLEAVASLKTTLQNIQKLMAIRDQIDKFRTDVDNAINTQLDVCNDCTTSLDTELVKPPSLAPFTAADKLAEPTTRYVSDLQRELDRLQSQLRQTREQ
jgi:hypothetical protein